MYMVVMVGTWWEMAALEWPTSIIQVRCVFMNIVDQAQTVPKEHPDFGFQTKAQSFKASLA